MTSGSQSPLIPHATGAKARYARSDQANANSIFDMGMFGQLDNLPQGASRTAMLFCLTVLQALAMLFCLKVLLALAILFQMSPQGERNTEPWSTISDIHSKGWAEGSS